jgi:hypothetical protein
LSGAFRDGALDGGAEELAIIDEAFASGSSVASTIEWYEISSGQLYT